MSHIVTIKTEIRDPTALAAACRRRQLPLPIHGEHHVFTNIVSGLAIQLPEWRFPVVVETNTGQVQFDNYGGRWKAQS